MRIREMLKRFVGTYDNHVEVRRVPVPGEAEDVVELVSHPKSCADADTELLVLRVEVGSLTEKLAESDATVKLQQELMERSLPIAFNCGLSVAVLLDLEPGTVVPALAADGKSVQVELDGLTLNVFPFDEKVAVFIAGTTERVEFAVEGGRFSDEVQDRIIGMHARSQRTDKALTPNLTLAGGTAVDNKTEAA